MASRVSDFYQYTTLTKRVFTLRERKTELNDKILQLGSIQNLIKGLSEHAAHSVLLRLNRICYIEALLKPSDFFVKQGCLRCVLSYTQLKEYVATASKEYEGEYRHCLKEIEQIEQRLQIMDDYGVKEIVQVDENSYTVKHGALMEIVELMPAPYQRAKRICRFKTAEERNAYLKSALKKKKP